MRSVRQGEELARKKECQHNELQRLLTGYSGELKRNLGQNYRTVRLGKPEKPIGRSVQCCLELFSDFQYIRLYKTEILSQCAICSSAAPV